MTEKETKSSNRATGIRIVFGLSLSTAAFLLSISHSSAHDNEVHLTEEEGLRCFSSNGLPDHSTGIFPNRNNPHSISEQTVMLCVDKSPIKGSRPNRAHGSIGVALNGVQIRPGTADWYDASSRRGFSRNRSSGWNLEGIGAKEQLGMDRNNAHVDQSGLYHYHGVSRALAKQGKGSLIGYAADGFEIHYVGKKQSSSFKLKQGVRPSAPGGRYDGTYNQDWQYVAGSGTLDQCNGGQLNGRFVYFATDTYPFFPRCLWGAISRDFQHGRKVGRGQGDQSPQGRPSRPDRPGAPIPQARASHSERSSFRNSNTVIGQNDRRDISQNAPRQRMAGRNFGPPAEALAACQKRSTGRDCAMIMPHGASMKGTCRQTPEGYLACVPAGHRVPHR